MFLSRLGINPRRLGGHRLLNDPHSMHAAVLAGLPTQPVPPSERGARVLWRVDGDNPFRPLLYVLSPEAPDLRHLVEQAGWSTAAPPFETKNYQPLLDRIRHGDTFAFRLTANPTRARPGGSDAQGRRGRGKRVQHVTVAQQVGWLLARADHWGFRPAVLDSGLPDVVLRDRRKRTFSRQGRRVTLSTATFEGRLEVVDAAGFRSSLVAGMGPGKGYGCGLLTLAPLNGHVVADSTG